MKLNDRLIKSELNKSHPHDKKLSDGEGLCLLIKAKTSKGYWKYNYRYNHKQKTLSLGQYPFISLKEARNLRMQAKELLSQNIDPCMKKQEEKQRKSSEKGNTFLAMALSWHKNGSISWSPKHAKNVLYQIEKDLFPFLGELPLTEITPSVVIELITHIQQRGAYDHATRILSRINSILNYAVRLEKLPANPCLSLKGYIKVPPTRHQPALPEKELVEFFMRLHDEPAFEETKLAMILLIITFTRVGSLRTMEWEDINFSKREWFIPKEKFKGKRQDLIVPLSDWAIQILNTLYQHDRTKTGLIFTATGKADVPMSENTLSKMMKRMGYGGIATPHGFRSLATDVLNENNFKPDVIERQLGHVESNSVRRAYLRTSYMDDRKIMMQWYSDWVKERYDQAIQQVNSRT